MGPVEALILLSFGGWLPHGQLCHISYFINPVCLTFLPSLIEILYSVVSETYENVKLPCGSMLNFSFEISGCQTNDK